MSEVVTVPNVYTTIRILRTTHAKLKDLGTKDENFDAIVLRLINAVTIIQNETVEEEAP